MNDELLVEMTPIEDKSRGIIKVIGVGGGGGNAVKNMYRKNTQGISYAVCNTDSQALSRTEIPVRIQLGSEGLGVGGDPMIGRAKAEESMKEIESLLSDGTQMVFITAGMGGGTGTGAAPVIAQMARERGILTIGVVTIPFAFEKRKRIEKALGGVMQLEKNVDALLVINNERLMEIYSDGITTCTEAFEHADDILSVSTHSIAEVITVEGIINRDFCDVKAVMQNGGSAIISIGYGEGEHRILKAVENALDSPLLTGVDIEHAQKMLCIVYTGQKRPVKISEMSEIQDFMDTLSPDLDVFFGLYPDEALDEEVKVSIIATGFNNMADIIDPADNSNERIQQLKGHYYGTKEKSAEGAKTMGEGAKAEGEGACSAAAGQAVSQAFGASGTTVETEPLIIIPEVPEEPASAPYDVNKPTKSGASATSRVPGVPAPAPRRRWVDRVSEYIKYIISED